MSDRRKSTIVSDANRLGLDYMAEANRLGTPTVPIVDVHTHVFGPRSASVFREAAEAYGVSRVFTMTPLEELPAVARELGEMASFIAVPDFFARDRLYALSSDYAERLRGFADHGVRIAKFWSAPRGVDFAERTNSPPHAFRLDQPHVQANMQLAIDLGMIIMVHVGDPDTWFATEYSDVSRYGTKAEQYGPLRECLRRYDVPFIAAHMGGWPEDLEFLDNLLQEHDQLYLDTSATKWMVRELSRHPRDRVQQFFQTWKGRLLFGTDVVTRDQHLSEGASDEEEAKSNSHEAAFDLYASRYWAMRTLLETDYLGESPVADPDLHRVDPERYTPHDAPTLRGLALSSDVLQSVYAQNISELFAG